MMRTTGIPFCVSIRTFYPGRTLTGVRVKNREQNPCILAAEVTTNLFINRNDTGTGFYPSLFFRGGFMHPCQTL